MQERRPGEPDWDEWFENKPSRDMWAYFYHDYSGLQGPTLVPHEMAPWKPSRVLGIEPFLTITAVEINTQDPEYRSLFIDRWRKHTKISNERYLRAKDNKGH